MNTASVIDPRIVAFIGEHHVLTLATCVPGEPHCASLFYAWLAGEGVFVVASEEQTRHAQEALQNAAVAGTVVLETGRVGLIRGLQFRGTMYRADSCGLAAKARRAYLRRFPYALLTLTPLWVIRPGWLKLTDNRLGFGKKITVTR